MPRLSDTMEEGAISTWHKRPGDKVAVGDVLVEIETDKAVMEYEAYQAGTLTQILVPEGQNADIGAPIALLDDGVGAAAEQSPSPERGEPAAPAPATSASPASAGTASASAAAASPAGNGFANGGATSDGSVGDGANGIVNGGGLNGATRNGAVNGEGGPSAGGRQLASPLVRKLARENHLDLSHVTGSGPGGRIIRADINDLLVTGHQAPVSATAAPGASAALAPAGTPGVPPASPPSAPVTSTAASATPATQVAAAAASVASADATVNGQVNSSPVSAGPASVASAPVAPETDDVRGTRGVPVSQVRRVIARRLSASAREIPHFYVTAVADAQDLMDLRATLNAQLTQAGRAKISVNDLLIRACALALREHPDMNVSYGGDASSVMLVHDRINIGVAVAAESGLIVPVIRDADTKTVTRLGAEARQLVALAAERKLTPAQTSGGTFTISNLGMYGVEQFTAIINPPESAILAVGATTREPTVVSNTGAGDTLEPRYRLRYTLSSDHRVIDGALAAKFLQTLTTLIEHPWMIIA
jgi:pyruvate dehydrogenase E2 component (dihydrolipoamide acetyltransferase)